MAAPSDLLKHIHKAVDEIVSALCAVLVDEDVRRYLPFMKAPDGREVRAFLPTLLTSWYDPTGEGESVQPPCITS